MNLERLQQIVASYGTRPDAWPEDERDDASKLLAENRALIPHNEVELDEVLDSFSISVSRNEQSRNEQSRNEQMIQRIMEQVTPTKVLPTLLEQMVAWLVPEGDFRTYWRPALAAAMPLVLGIALGMTLTNIDDGSNWDEELYLLAITESTDGYFTEAYYSEGYSTEGNSTEGNGEWIDE